MSEIQQPTARLIGWFRESAGPLWARAGWDGEKGGFFEALDFTGTPCRGHRRVRVQSRQVYTFSMIGKRSWLAGAESIAAEGFDYLVKKTCPDDGRRGCAHIIDDNGSIIDDRRDLYDQAFLLLACAGRIDAAGCARAAAIGERTMAFLNAELRSPYGGWLENDQGDLPRRQNPHMHLLEAFMALYRATGDDHWRTAADDVVDLFDRYFFDDTTSTLGEYFSADFTERDAARGAIIEPGHMMEWVWLLNRYAVLTGSDLRRAAAPLYEAAKALADNNGFLPDAIGAGDGPGARRLWPQTEYIRASLCLSQLTGDAYNQDAAAMIEKVFETYLNHPVAGLWCDQYDAHEKPIARDVPASILYHLYGAVAECARVAEGEDHA